MRKIDLRPIPMRERDGEPVRDSGGAERVMDPVEWLADRILGSDPVNGLDFKEMKERLALIDKIESAEDAVLLEDGEWERVRASFDAFKLAVVMPAYIALGERMHGAERVEPGAARDG